ncbi:hypothetical protein CLU79DRAFT_401163 [Phycomyces nitens]|nr:hypothetical protein CLU79DRAFT_401163 [Phycomyces nitens]
MVETIPELGFDRTCSCACQKPIATRLQSVERKLWTWFMGKSTRILKLDSNYRKIGHPIIDMAMDYRQSDFTTIDICNLMSPDPYNGDEDFSPQSSFVFEPHANDTSLATDHSTSRSQPPQTLPNHSPLSNRPISLLNPGPLANEPGSSFGTNTPVVIPMTTPQHILSIPPLIELPNDDSFSVDPELPRATQSCPSMLTHSTVDTKSGLISDISPQTSSFTQRKARVSALNSSLNSKRIFDNLEFCPIDVLAQTLPFEDNTFDYVQQSLVTLVYTEEDWDRMIDELVRVTKPGGYIQLTEVDYYTQAAAHKHQVWQENAIDMVLKTQNVNTRAAMLLSDMLTEAGLAEVETKLVSIPKGSWGLDIGLLWEENWLAFTCSVAPYLLEMTGTTWEDLEELQYIPPEEVAKLKSFNNAYCCWGRKPMA